MLAVSICAAVKLSPRTKSPTKTTAEVLPRFGKPRQMALSTPHAPGAAALNQNGSSALPPGTRPAQPIARTILAALALLAFATAGFAIVRASTANQTKTAPIHTVVVTPPTAPTFSASDVQKATAKACTAWDTASMAIADASRKSAAAPKDWDNPITRAADAATSRVTLTQVSYLRTQVTSATPTDLRANLTNWQDLAVAIEHAQIARLGNSHDSLIAQQTSLNRTIESQCGLE
ncbi:Uncharacterised protein [Mycobacteroides abscessus subsp. abscessus]|nr:Uncharacterised protein [Mycobacteroides abscessus subsp. abscessus]SHY26614.1 Uncharacterised protein [Mycobacteroides abscessus subsp. abscessus]SID24786.1 Uncharacterised protein [Mycobacteroides abscessus subsp. abscessus]SKK59749.1 Uncharacterised protein [Mycobacteroides abscessus subsp. abscessus]SKP32744.1 Uncharacterised protein [Mycobacteroides abscessus subsp. abscessus]